MKLWVDDERPTPDTSWVRMVSSAGGIAELYHARAHGIPVQEVSLDHDLGGEDTGFKVLDWMIEKSFWPNVLTIHTSNPPARKRMLQAANAEAPASTEIYVITDHLAN